MLLNWKYEIKDLKKSFIWFNFSQLVFSKVLNLEESGKVVQ